jgi:hypothetical protein
MPLRHLPLKVYLFTFEVVIKCGTSAIVTKNTRTHRANAVHLLRLHEPSM